MKYDYKQRYEGDVPGFQVNMQLIADAMERNLLHPELYLGSTNTVIRGARIYSGQEDLNPEYLYILKNSQIDENILSKQGMALLIIGKTDVKHIPYNNDVIVLLTYRDPNQTLEQIQDFLEKYRIWDRKIQMAIYSETPLDDILLASMEVFRNPMVIHDSNFFILSDPKHSPLMSDWEIDKRTNMEMVPMGTINDFRTDLEYLQGLKSKKTVLFSADQTGYRILYRNLWSGDRYEGRILVDEVHNSIQPGDFYVLDYLGKILEFYISRRHLVWLSIGNDLSNFLRDSIKTDHIDDRQAMNYLQYLHWNRNDRYVCLKIESDQIAFNLISANVLMGQIETQVQSGQAFYMDNSIVVVVNLSYHQETTAEVISKLAIIMREGLLKIGISSEIQDFIKITKAYRQAHIALDFGRISNSMYWYYYFDDYMLEYIVDCAGREIPLDMICADALSKLKKYDQENNADLYHTLHVYLRLEKNVLRTAKELFIHRSTLAYRLDRIQKVINVNLDNPRERLKLEISFYMENGLIDHSS